MIFFKYLYKKNSKSVNNCENLRFILIRIKLNYKLIFKEERSKTHHALIVCNLSTVTVFGTLAFSTTPVLRAIGTTVAIGAFLCLLFSFIFASKPKMIDNPSIEKY